MLYEPDPTSGVSRNSDWSHICKDAHHWMSTMIIQWTARSSGWRRGGGREKHPIRRCVIVCSHPRFLLSGQVWCFTVCHADQQYPTNLSTSNEGCGLRLGPYGLTPTHPPSPTDTSSRDPLAKFSGVLIWRYPSLIPPHCPPPPSLHLSIVHIGFTLFDPYHFDRLQACHRRKSDKILILSSSCRIWMAWQNERVFFLPRTRWARYVGRMLKIPTKCSKYVLIFCVIPLHQ